MIPKVSGQGPERGLFLGKIAFQFPSEGLQFIEVGFDIFRQHVFQPLSHALGQNGSFSIGADREFERAIGHDAPHVKVTTIRHIGHVEQVSHQATESNGPFDFTGLDGGHDADVVSSDLPRPCAPSGNGPDVGMPVDQRLDGFAEGRGKHPHAGMGAAFEKEVKFFLGDFRASEDVEGETFGLQEDGELGIHG